MFEILKLVVIVSVILITRYLVPFLTSKIKNTRYAEFVDMVAEAVRWAQQTVGEHQGEHKKEMVVDFLSRLALEKNLNISAEQLEVLIESAVYAMKAGAI